MSFYQIKFHIQKLSAINKNCVYDRNLSNIMTDCRMIGKTNNFLIFFANLLNCISAGKAYKNFRPYMNQMAAKTFGY